MLRRAAGAGHQGKITGRLDFDGIDRGTDKRGRRLRCGESEKTTTGWRASCSCKAGAAVPATVLDPFLGAGTTRASRSS
jgi:hypothetical protein